MRLDFLSSFITTPCILSESALHHLPSLYFYSQSLPCITFLPFTFIPRVCPASPPFPLLLFPESALHHLPSVHFYSQSLPCITSLPFTFIPRVYPASPPFPLLLFPESALHHLPSLYFFSQSLDRKSTRLNSSHSAKSRMPSSA